MATGLIRPTQRLNDPDWVESVLKTTWIPFAIIAALAMIAGMLGSEAVPEATTMMEVIAGLGAAKK